MGGAARIWEAESRRRRAELLATLGTPAPEIEAELACALAVARRQGATSLELRAATSLLRLRQKRGDGPDTSQARASLGRTRGRDCRRR
jgi:hypothetical protein